MSVQVTTNWFLPLTFIDACLIVIQHCPKSFILFSIIYFVSFSLNYKQTALRLRLTCDCPLTPMWYFMCCVVGILQLTITAAFPIIKETDRSFVEVGGEEFSQ